MTNNNKQEELSDFFNALAESLLPKNIVLKQEIPQDIQDQFVKTGKETIDAVQKYVNKLQKFAREGNTSDSAVTNSDMFKPTKGEVTPDPPQLQFVKMYIGQEQIAEALNIRSNQLRVANVSEVLLDGTVELLVAIDSSAKVNVDYEASVLDDGYVGNLRRQSLDKKESLETLLSQELAKLSQEVDEIEKEHGNSLNIQWSFNYEMRDIKNHYDYLLTKIEAIKLLLLNNEQ